MTLLAVQRAFHAGLLADDVPAPLPQPPRFRRGFEIYRNAYRTRLVGGLRESYERVWSWIGDAAFDQAAIHHVILHPPYSWSLDDAGAGFDRTLAELFPADPEVAELAWLEWQMQLAFKADDALPIDAAGFTALTSDFDEADWGAMRLDLAPGVALHPISTACVQVWAAMERNESWTGALALEQPETVLVWRQDLQPRFRTVPLREAQALDLVRGGASFAAICTAHGSDDAAAEIGAMLGGWIVDGLITGLAFNEV